MALEVQLITKDNPEQPEKTLVDGIHTVIFVADDGNTDAVNIAAAEAAVQAAGHAIPDGYFDTLERLGPPTTGIATTDQDIIVILPRASTRVIA